ncbi:MAG: Nre family DNA repair protein [Thermoplasmata archaeon]
MLADSDVVFQDAKSVRKSALCILCKGSRNLCGKSRCPLLVKYYFRSKVVPLIDSLNLDGSSPPSVFIGRQGYPKVYVGPLVPPVHGNTEILDLPEMWLNKSMDDIINYRFQLVRGMHRTSVHNLEDAGRIVNLTRELAMATYSADVEAQFSKKPSTRLVLDDSSQPMGPSAPLRGFDVDNLKVDHRIDRAHFDWDLLAKDAVIELYQQDIPITKIQRAFSVGAFGLRKNRKMVPTRWSITAVDDIAGKELREVVKTFTTIDDFRVHWSSRLDNRWAVLMMPTKWRYELIEAWYPETVWNPRKGSRIVLLNDWEGYEGRTTYADIGGCYYAARLALCEDLIRERRQASTVILREAHPGYILPVGVWNVRENVRNALRQPYESFDTLESALFYISKRMAIPIGRWIRNSHLLKDMLYQRRLEDFIKG